MWCGPMSEGQLSPEDDPTILAWNLINFNWVTTQKNVVVGVVVNGVVVFVVHIVVVVIPVVYPRNLPLKLG